MADKLQTIEDLTDDILIGKYGRISAADAEQLRTSVIAEAEYDSAREIAEHLYDQGWRK